MKKLFCVLAVACVVAVVAVSSAVAGGSSGKGTQTLSATCTVLGKVTVHASSGASAWLNNSHYVLLKFAGTFTPTVGTAQSFTKTYGHKTGFMSGPSHTCTGSQSDSTGTFSFTATVAPTANH